MQSFKGLISRHINRYPEKNFANLYLQGNAVEAMKAANPGMRTYEELYQEPGLKTFQGNTLLQHFYQVFESISIAGATDLVL